MSIYGNPVYLGQEGGGGGAAEVLLNEHKYQQSGGSISLVETVTIVNAGTYFVAAHGYSTGITVTLNGVNQTLSFTNSSDYTFWYEETLLLNAGDVVYINIPSSGKSALSAQVIRIA